ncbi:MAG: undecaprenyldiphospho-muramoylpentapeptide beta-N-acetylglucosaminyltransferase [Muribaculaceae bacterium]|nr:undecaprenyldiphospho-muramoylpentapeptide beta-N-acetylglucosaminyltransferase [Muribaculaceae bacterium]
MKKDDKQLRVIVSGGGTGGHIFPAVSIANALKARTGAEILFVGAEDRMEMERVPAAGYKIVGLPVAGFNRKNLFKNFAVLLKLAKSVRMAKKVVRDFKPDIAIGVGGYASGPTLKSAQKLGVPTLLQEQNSYAGVTNKMLAKGADCICVAYEGMDRFFPADKIELTGNPVRKDLLSKHLSPVEARRAFGLDGEKPTLLVVGGSLGARTLNEAMEKDVQRLADAGLQVIWQTGKYFGDRGEKAAAGRKGIVVTKFISDMASAYAAADLVVSRAGAGSISELQLLGKAAILVPSPNVAEDHQTKNARALSDRGAAILVTDAEASDKLADTALETLADEKKLSSMRSGIAKMALRDADEKIVDHILEIINKK